MTEDELSYEIIGAAIEVHRVLGGPGLLEKVYEAALCCELRMRQVEVETQLAVPIAYKGHAIKDPLVLDVLVEGRVIVECKAAVEHNPIFESQLLTYLRMTGKKLGLLINFGGKQVKDGIHRVVNNL